MANSQDEIKARLASILARHGVTAEQLDPVTIGGKGATEAVKTGRISLCTANRIARNLGIRCDEILDFPEPDENGQVILFKCKACSDS